MTMWLKKNEHKNEEERDTGAPEKQRHSRYYEHDGALRPENLSAEGIQFVTQ